ncbi:ComF family protein [Glaciecola sp. 1036]|uniref:ComF family protein n=1 Tax=Alteromonadaceae TaxID=72275 RepID=UPI003D068840
MPGTDLLEYPVIAKHLYNINYESLRSIGTYSDILAGLIKKLKFSKQPIASAALTLLFEAYVLRRIMQTEKLPEKLIPIPLSEIRLFKRGFNQAALLAEDIGKIAKIPVMHALKRHKHTRQQSSLGKEARLDNLFDAFKLVKPLPYKHVCLIDDVVTTGATLSSAVETIKAKTPDIKVSIWCMAVAEIGKD